MAENVNGKYEALAGHARELLFRQQDRFARLDQKAAVQLSATTVLLGIGGYFAKWVVDEHIPPATAPSMLAPEWWLLSLTGLLLLLILLAWAFFLLAIKVHKVESPRMDQSVLDFCQKNSAVQFSFYVAQRSSQAHASVLQAIDRKARFLCYGYRSSFAALGLCVVLAAMYVWDRSVVDQKPKEQSEMIEAPGGEDPEPESDVAPEPTPEPTPEPAPSEPDPSIEGPSNIIVTEGYEPTGSESTDPEGDQ